MTDAFDAISLENIRRCRADLGESIVRTPVLRWQGDACRGLTEAGTDIWLKLELFQHTGTFMARGRVAPISILLGAHRDQTPVALSAIFLEDSIQLARGPNARHGIRYRFGIGVGKG